MLKDEEQAITKEATKIGCFFVIKQGRIFARIKKGWGRGIADTNLQLNQPKELKNELTNELNNSPKEEAELAYTQAKAYKAELIKQYNTEKLSDDTDINNFNNYYLLLLGDNQDYLTA